MGEAQFRLADPQGQLLAEIADPSITVGSVMVTYAFALLDADAVEWPVVNRAIIDRWSAATLDRVKRGAWKRYERKRQQEARDA